MSHLNDLTPETKASWLGFFAYASVTILLSNYTWRSSYITDVKKDDYSEKYECPQYYQFCRRYFVVFFLASFGNWLQGPFMYEVFNYYGYTKKNIGVFYITSNISSLVFGSSIGIISDWIGHKKGCIIYCVISALSCFSLNFSSFRKIIITSRILSGLASPLLATTFEAWLIHEYNLKKKFPVQKIQYIYSVCTFANALIAILAALISSIIAQRLGLLYIFNLSSVTNICCALVIMILWDENYGASSNIKELQNIFKSASLAMRNIGNIKEVWISCIIQSSMDTTIHIFILIWTPSLPIDYDKGLIFAYLMTSIMLGNTLSSLFNKKWTHMFYQVYVYLTLTFVAFFVSSEVYGIARVFFFCLFEACVGMHWTTYHSLRAQFILPKTAQATILSISRIPSNLISIILCIYWSDIPMKALMKLCSAMVFTAIFFFRIIHLKILNSIEQEPDVKTLLLP